MILDEKVVNIINQLKQLYDAYIQYIRYDADLENYKSQIQDKYLEADSKYLKEKEKCYYTYFFNYESFFPKLPTLANQLIESEIDYDDLLLLGLNNNYKFLGSDDYIKEKNDFINDCLKFDKVFDQKYNDYVKKVRNCIEEFKNNKEFLKNELQDKVVQYNVLIENEKKVINENSIISEKYYYLIPEIIEILEDGRADKLTDSLNMAIKEDEERRFRATQLSIEEDRLRELQRQTELAERQEDREMEKERERNRRRGYYF